VYYVSSPEMDDPKLRENDDMVMTLWSHQWLDWRELRFQSFNSPAARRAVNAFAASIVDAARRPSPPRPADAEGSSADSSSPRTAGPAMAEESEAVSAAGASAFISYNYRDRVWLDRLLQQLDLLMPAGNIAAFSDRDVRRATSGTNDVRAAIDAARVAVVLISGDYLGSDVVNEELPYLLARVESKRLVVIPVLLTPSLFEETALARFQAANPPGRPLSVMPRTEAERATKAPDEPGGVVTD
jgi:TIR domain